MRKLKLFPKIFVYTFLVMLLVTVTAHVFLYILAPQMTLSTNGTFKSGVMLENSLNSGELIKSAIVKALPFSMAGCTVIAAVGSLIFSRSMAGPIQKIGAAVKQMERLEKDARCPVNSEDEIGFLAVSVNRLYFNLLSTIVRLTEEKQKVCAAEQAKLDFLRAASHELKTPVTALNAILENMILGVGKYKDHSTYLLECKEIAGQLALMIREILDTSRADFIGTNEDLKVLEIGDFLERICGAYTELANARGLTLILEIQEKCQVRISEKSLEKIMSNLLSNAVAYTKEAGRIRVVLCGRAIWVENECEPIAVGILERLFEPFYRPDFSRNRKDGGNGLGLYIVDTLSRAMGLSYTFEPVSEPLGMRFTLFL